MDWRTVHVDRKKVGSDSKTIGSGGGKIRLDLKTTRIGPEKVGLD